MWVLFAFGSSLFVGLTSILAKCGIRKIGFTAATTIRTVVVPIDKLSILVTIAFSRVVFHEHLTAKSAAGLAAIVAGTAVMLIPTL